MADEFVTPDGVQVCVGQVWQDCDRRHSGRRVQVTALLPPARGRVHGRAEVSAIRPDGKLGRTTIVSIQRLKPTATGYRLVKSVV